jgi:hypothetical protein
MGVTEIERVSEGEMCGTVCNLKLCVNFRVTINNVKT